MTDEDEPDEFLSILETHAHVFLRLFVLCSVSFVCGYLNWGFFIFLILFAGLSLWTLLSVSRSALKRSLSSRIETRIVSQTEPEAETVEYLNKLFDLMHLMYSRGLDAWFCEQLSSLLEPNCPVNLRYLKIKDFSLGKATPNIEEVELSTDLSQHKMQLDLSISWVSGLKAILAGKMRTTGVEFTIAVRDLVLVGRLRIIGTLHPDSSCYFGPMSVSFLEKPQIDLNLKTIAGVDVMDLPGVGNSIRDMLSGYLIEQYLLWPNKIDFDLSGSSENETLVEAGEHVRQLKTNAQYGGACLRDSDWHTLYKQGLRSSSFPPGRVIAIDVGVGVSRPILCRVVRGVVRMVVWQNSSQVVLEPCLNHNVEENKFLENLSPIGDKDEGNPLDNLVIAEFKTGDYFGEMTFVNPSVYTSPDPPEVTAFIAFVTSEETEVCVVAQSKLMDGFGGTDGLQERFYRMVAVGLSDNLKLFMAKSRIALIAPDENVEEQEPIRLTQSVDASLNETSTRFFPKAAPLQRLSKSPFKGRGSVDILKFGDRDKKQPHVDVMRHSTSDPTDSSFEPSSLNSTSPVIDFRRRNSQQRERMRKVVSGMSTNVPRHIKQFARSPGPSKMEKESVKIYVKDHSKYISRRMEIEPITLEQLKKNMLANLSVPPMMESKYQFYVVPHASKLQMQVGNVAVKSGTVAMIQCHRAANQGSAGYVVFHKNKFILEPSRPQEKDQAAQFIVHTKGLVKLRDSTAKMISLKNVRANCFISRPAVGKRLKTSDRALSHEFLDVSSPTWTIFAQMMSEPVPFYLAKDNQTLKVGKKAEPLQFSLVPLDIEATTKGEKEEDSFDPTLPLDDSLLISDVVRDHSHVSFVLHSEAPTDFHRYVEVLREEVAKGLGAEREKLKGTVRKGLKALKKKEDGSQANKQFQICRMLNIRQGEQLLHDFRCRLSHNGGMINGRLYVFDRYLGFYGSFFATKLSIVWRLAHISDMSKNKRNLILKSDVQEMNLRFASLEMLDTVYTTLQKQSEVARTMSSDPNYEPANIPSTVTAGTLSSEIGGGSGNSSDTKGLTSDDWRQLLKGAKVRCYEKDSVILGEGQLTTGLYQISHGHVRIEKKGVSVAKLLAGEIFGEMSFLTGGKEGTVASASVVAGEEEVDVYFISNEYIQKLFQTKGFGGRFYEYLASCLSKRFFKTVTSHF